MAIVSLSLSFLLILLLDCPQICSVGILTGATGIGAETMSRDGISVDEFKSNRFGRGRSESWKFCRVLNAGLHPGKLG
ncbi:uncharacterized protein BDZ83DRAFT_162842 [Colletotrichum acutatum]|uniref:Uncharacterized protein n=1 Tax=Glomerella acutata TaxID=27357 RepID=A0AAD8XQ61_GLOAC|nr:uncharacterized protein BDZ83DRAFT_162842 [Colletotrichum acutatum]KAK1731548.1 hypothetical protein BDZ83DRAFT_162842 [Colletotrichum acutatum]